MERRQEPRRPADWSGRVQWQSDGRLHQEPAVIRNYSAAGFYLELEDAGLKPGTLAECRVEMPAELAFGGGVILHCIGEIVHVRPLEGDTPRIGAGFRTDEFSFAELAGQRSL